MLDFYASFSIFVILAVIMFSAGIIFFIVKIFNIFYDKISREKNEKTVQNTADIIINLKENKGIEKTEELLKHLPKQMKLIEENNELIIKYKNLIYNVNKGRFIVDR